MTHGLTDDQISVICEKLALFPQVREALIFGSRAMENFKAGSDIDLALKGEIDFTTVSKVKYVLEEETLIPYFFDVVDYAALENPDLKSHIDQHGKSIYSTS